VLFKTGLLFYYYIFVSLAEGSYNTFCLLHL